MEDLLFWLLIGGPILAPFVIGAIGAIRDSLKAQRNQVGRDSQVRTPMNQKPIIYQGFVVTPSEKECYEAVKLLMRDIDEGISYLANYYGVPAPMIEINDAMLKAKEAEGLSSGDTIYLRSKPRISTVLHEFFHYVVGRQGYIYSHKVEEEKADKFAREVLDKASMHLKYSATLDVDFLDLMEKNFKKLREKFRKLLEEAFPGHKEIVEELLDEVIPDFSEEEDKE